MITKFNTLQSIVDQLEFCGYVTADNIHSLEHNAAFIALKVRAAAEAETLARSTGLPVYLFTCLPVWILTPRSQRWGR